MRSLQTGDSMVLRRLPHELLHGGYTLIGVTDTQSLKVTLPGATPDDVFIEDIEDVKNTCYLHAHIDALTKHFGGVSIN
jgi:hypothetical protein